MKRIVFICIGFFLLGLLFIFTRTIIQQSNKHLSEDYIDIILPSPTSGIPAPSHIPLPFSYEIPMKKHVFQTFNNCGPASLSMLLSYHGIDVTQNVIGQALRPYQNNQGINDDKSVFVSELAQEAERTYTLESYYRPNGTLEKLKHILAAGYPVLVRTWLDPDDDIGHYRIIRGYDDTRELFIQDDSYHGKNIYIPYDQFENMWKPFHYEYLVVVKPEEKEIIESILGNDLDIQKAWDHMYHRAQEDIKETPSESAYSHFSMSVASHHKGNYQESVSQFELSKHGLPRRMLWYQIEPLDSYLKIGDYDQLFLLTNEIFQDENKGFSELYILRAKAYIALGDINAAKKELQQAIYYNGTLSEPKELLSMIE